METNLTKVQENNIDKKLTNKEVYNLIAPIIANLEEKINEPLQLIEKHIKEIGIPKAHKWIGIKFCNDDKFHSLIKFSSAMDNFRAKQ